jgi:hypothetical protein
MLQLTTHCSVLNNKLSTPFHHTQKTTELLWYLVCDWQKSIQYSCLHEMSPGQLASLKCSPCINKYSIEEITINNTLTQSIIVPLKDQ